MENRAAAERQAVSAARGRVLDSAVAAMLDVRELLAAVSEASAAGAAVTTASATSAASSVQAAVAGVLTVVRSPAPSLAMYEMAWAALRAARGQLRRTRLSLVAVEAREACRAADEALVAAERKVREARRAARTTSRAAAAGTERRGSAESVDPARARSAGVEPTRQAVVVAALREAEAARASLASMQARETDAVLEVAQFDALGGFI